MGNLARALQLYAQILTVFVGYVGGTYLLGSWLEGRGRGSETLTMVLVGFGFVLAMIHIYKLSTRQQSDGKEKQSEKDGQ